MPHEVFIFGDSHWRLFFPFTNHGDPYICHEQDGIVTLDTTANELSGATMWGLQKEETTHKARLRILNTIDEVGGVENVGLVFGEVDVRYHWQRYYLNGKINISAVLQLLNGYRKFIDEQLLNGRVRNKVFVYYGFRYNTAQPELQKHKLHRVIEELLPFILQFHSPRVITITPGNELEGIDGLVRPEYVCADGVHLLPEAIFPQFVFPILKEHLL